MASNPVSQDMLCLNADGESLHDLSHTRLLLEFLDLEEGMRIQS